MIISQQQISEILGNPPEDAYCTENQKWSIPVITNLKPLTLSIIAFPSQLKAKMTLELWEPWLRIDLLVENSSVKWNSIKYDRPLKIIGASEMLAPCDQDQYRKSKDTYFQFLAMQEEGQVHLSNPEVASRVLPNLISKVEWPFLCELNPEYKKLI